MMRRGLAFGDGEEGSSFQARKGFCISSRVLLCNAKVRFGSIDSLVHEIHGDKAGRGARRMRIGRLLELKTVWEKRAGRLASSIARIWRSRSVSEQLGGERGQV